MERTALNKYNAPEMLGALIGALEAAGLDDTIEKLKHMGVTRLVNDAWMHRSRRASELEQNWGELIR